MPGTTFAVAAQPMHDIGNLAAQIGPMVLPSIIRVPKSASRSRPNKA
jgi:hypothetical protein